MIRGSWWISVLGLTLSWVIWPAATVFLYRYGPKGAPTSDSSKDPNFCFLLHEIVFSMYRQNRRYFFWIHLLKRFSLVTIILFLSDYPGMQVIAITGSLLFFFMLFVYTAPFERLATNILESVGIFASFFVTLFAYGIENVPSSETGKFAMALNGMYAALIGLGLLGLLVSDLLFGCFDRRKEKSRSSIDKT